MLWVLLKHFLEMNHYIIDLLTQTQPDLDRCLREKLKKSPMGKFAANVEIALQTLTI
jgi:hypothetical protein